MKKNYLKPAVEFQENLASAVLCESPFTGNTLEPISEEDYNWEG